MKLSEVRIYRKARSHLRKLLGVEQTIRSLRSDPAMSVPFEYDLEAAAPTETRLAVICHIFHAELSDEIFFYLSNIKYPVDIYVTTDDLAKKQSIVNAFEQWQTGQLEVRLIQNRGRDIAPKLVGLRDVYDRYDIVLFLHSKRSLHTDEGDEWRRFLFDNLVGSSKIVASVLEIFSKDERIGAVMSQHLKRLRKWIIWRDTFSLAQPIARRMGVEVHPFRPIDFPSGSMFWVRTAALRPLLDLEFKIEDFPEESGQVGGTIAHAIERLFLISCEKSGYDWVKIAARSSSANLGVTIPIGSPREIVRFNDRHRFRLLPGRDHHSEVCTR